MNSDRLLSHGPLIVFFVLIQLFGMFVLGSYAPVERVVSLENGTNYSVMDYKLPSPLSPPQDIDYRFTLFQLVASLAFVVIVVLLLMRLHVVRVLRFWFFAVSVVASSVTLYVFLRFIPYGGYAALSAAAVVSFFKVFRPNIITHNLVEILVFPGIAAILVPLFSIPTIIALFIVICVYDAYAVWHSGIMQKMAKYQIQKVRVFSGFLLPQFLTSKGIVNPFSVAKTNGRKRVKLSMAILGGGDIVFPMLLAGVLLYSGYAAYSYAVIVGAAAGLFYLISRSERGKFYPAMPFIAAGCLIAAAILYMVSILL